MMDLPLGKELRSGQLEVVVNDLVSRWAKGGVLGILGKA